MPFLNNNYLSLLLAFTGNTSSLEDDDFNLKEGIDVPFIQYDGNIIYHYELSYIAESSDELLYN